MESLFKASVAGLVLMFGLASPMAIRAYEVVLHRNMSGKAFEQAIQDYDFTANLGLARLQKDINGETREVWLRKRVEEGSDYEDDFLRPLYHFFDPLTSKGLKQSFAPAPTWALGLVDGTDNAYSIPKAREEMYVALTSPDFTVRQRAFAGLFRRVGHMIHLIQDMAQPQHVRDDPHFSIGGPHTDAIFTDYSRYERYTQYLDVKSFGPYPTVQFSDYLKYWKDGTSRGLAEFTNANFVSEGTNFKPDGSVTNYPSPSLGGTVLSEPTTLVETLNGQQFNVPVRYRGNTFTDGYTGQSVTNNYLTANSIFDFVHKKYKAQPVYTLTDDNHKAYADRLVPRAVGYSAGLINFFFRGRMEISLPDEGVYGIVDHAVAKQSDQGFTKIKLKLKNTTPAIAEPSGVVTPQHMSGGALVAVAKYYRNPCYQPDLSGELMQTGFPSGCSKEFFFSTTEEIAVSAHIDNVTLSSTATLPQTFAFDFSRNPIPINARDLYLQVVYRGSLGIEGDALVVATKDISEPTYISYLNSTDYFWVLDNFYTPGEISNSALLYGWLKRICDSTSPVYPPNINPEPLRFQYRFGGPVLAAVTLPAKRYARIAVLVDYDVPILSPDVLLPLSGVCFNEPWATEFKGFSGARNQLDKDTNVYHSTWVEKFRGLNRVNIIGAHKADPSVLSILPDEVTNEMANLESLPDDGPYPVTITF